MTDTILFDEHGARVASWLGEGNRREFGPRKVVTDPEVYARHGWTTPLGSVTLPDDEKAWVLRSIAFRRGGKWVLSRVDYWAQNFGVALVGTLDQFQLQDVLRDEYNIETREPRTFPSVAALEVYVRHKP